VTKIDILLLVNDRPVHYIELQGRIFAQLSEESKKRIRLFICPTNESKYLTKFFPSDLDVQILNIQTGRYLDKVKAFLELSHDVVIKFDDDCFMGPALWDNLIAAHSLLDNEAIQLVTPTVSTNIPLVDVVDRNFLSSEVRARLHTIYLKTYMPESLWGVDYSSLNLSTVFSNKWDMQKFYHQVSKLRTHYKGIHPVRLSLEACKVLFDFFIRNFGLVLGRNASDYIEFSSPYFTNNLFLIKKNVWVEALKYPSDGYDEVPLSLMCSDRSMLRIALLGGVCIHPMYNTVYSSASASVYRDDDGRSVESRMVAMLSDKFHEAGI
jgi:hypothetical protein